MSSRTRNPADLTPSSDVVGSEAIADSEFREKWEGLELARAVAAELLRYRRDNDLNQTELGRRLGMKQPQVARLEAAETLPGPGTIAKVVGVTGAEFAVSYTPAERASTLLTEEARDAAVVHRRGNGAVVVALSSGDPSR